MAVNVVDWFVFTTNFVITLNLFCFIYILRSYISKSTFCTLGLTVFLVIAVFEVIAVVVNGLFFSNISTLSSDDIPTGLIISATLYSFIGILPVIYYFISFCGQWPETRHKYIAFCFTSFIYFTLFVCVLATLHLPGSSTQKWENAVNYSYISVGNFIFLASQVAVTTSIFSLLTVLYYYAIIAQHNNIVVNNQHQDSLLSGSSRERGYGSTTLTVNE